KNSQKRLKNPMQLRAIVGNIIKEPIKSAAMYSSMTVKTSILTVSSGNSVFLKANGIKARQKALFV
ncbi:MAG: hypothetical protein WCS82_05295, partial [Candidatus Riflebacteria bacterium]